MSKLIAEKEWNIMRHEAVKGRSLKQPFTGKNSLRRELLLIAQCLLSSYQRASGHRKKFIGKIYRKTMNAYSSMNL
ncbi:MAG: hypothetical protein HYW25_02440 [Candidatus Aenigmarchaeota archaeon]|nr:hypothetical protein [Candidatus Aenigmarchaeota archaeon]